MRARIFRELVILHNMSEINLGRIDVVTESANVSFQDERQARVRSVKLQEQGRLHPQT